MMAAVDSYLAVRRATGFTLSNTEYLLRSFAGFAADRRQTHIRTATAVEWAGQATSVAQRHTRYQTVCRFAQYLRVEDFRHQPPPANYFGYRKTRRVPHIYSRDEINGLIVAATKLPSSDSLLPKTYAALISLLAATGLRISEALHLLVSDGGDRSVLGAPPSSAPRWRRATPGLLESPQRLPNPAEICGCAPRRRPMAADS